MYLDQPRLYVLVFCWWRPCRYDLIHGTAPCRPYQSFGTNYILRLRLFLMRQTHAPGRDVFKALHSRSSALPLSQTAIRTTLSP